MASLHEEREGRDGREQLEAEQAGEAYMLELRRR
jgi:hypothetical protein